MENGMYLSAAGAHVQSQRLQVLSNNLANVNTPGFKREFAVFQALQADPSSRGQAVADLRALENIGGGVTFNETVTDFSSGTLQYTGNASQLAINGDGFFLVAKDGEQFLTKAGNFQFASDGKLVTDRGDPVLSQDRQPLILPPGAKFEFRESGTLVVAGNETPLAIVKPQSLGDLSKAGENLFALGGEMQDVVGAGRNVKIGYVEQSGVQPVVEMTELIETSRAYEANVRMIQNQDQLFNALISRVLRV